MPNTKTLSTALMNSANPGGAKKEGKCSEWASKGHKMSRTFRALCLQLSTWIPFVIKCTENCILFRKNPLRVPNLFRVVSWWWALYRRGFLGHRGICILYIYFCVPYPQYPGLCARDPLRRCTENPRKTKRRNYLPEPRFRRGRGSGRGRWLKEKYYKKRLDNSTEISKQQ